MQCKEESRVECRVPNRQVPDLASEGLLCMYRVYASSSATIMFASVRFERRFSVHWQSSIEREK